MSIPYLIIQVYKACSNHFFQAMGGSSVLNSMIYIRGNREDYNDWSKLGNSGWSYEEVLPYFKKSEGNRVPEVSN